MRHLLWPLALALCACDVVPDQSDTAVHPKDPHSLFPEVAREGAQIATGVIDDDPLDQPIPFTHYRHATVLQIDCEYCHTEARRSIHAGIPPVEACMGCHQWVFTDSVQIQKIQAYWNDRQPIPWNKVHDLPDYVYFSHKRHVRAGVECEECHGDVEAMGQWPDGNADLAKVLQRDASLQMAWCLDCHATHVSLEENYSDLADLRRTELKDCWTCHK
ncbi:MAG: cytochrome c3 family protein [Deltaproteobacteria bacterium]|nr:cytochrome c3 family protein [Deltaproteobacteria bacterium]